MSFQQNPSLLQEKKNKTKKHADITKKKIPNTSSINNQTITAAHINNHCPEDGIEHEAIP